ncbi:MAG: hypothetical protein PHG19_11590, partial [Anaerotignum sp.]|nr:hypothetical protein [Anaerotignum sp.]
NNIYYNKKRGKRHYYFLNECSISEKPWKSNPVDTLVVCTCSAGIILLTARYNITDVINVIKLAA